MAAMEHWAAGRDYQGRRICHIRKKQESALQLLQQEKSVFFWLST
jgi:hypothetical protein